MIRLIFLFLCICFNSIESFSAELDSKSIYQLDHQWISQQGKSVKLKDLAGHPAVVTMTFASCPGVCPLMVNDMKSFDKVLNKNEKSKIRYMTFSIDPSRDTPKELTSFFKKMKLDKRWTLFTSNDDQVREMAAALGFSYKSTGDGDFTHSTSLFLLSSEGVLLAKKDRSSDWKEFIELYRREITQKK